MKNKNELLLSIITINRNNAAGLLNTINSVNNQIFENSKIEFLIIDGASSHPPKFDQI